MVRIDEATMNGLGATVSADLASQVIPYLMAVIGTYGAKVIDKIGDEAADATADATVGSGRRILRRLLASARSAPALAVAVDDIALHPTDDHARDDLVATLRAQVRKALTVDPRLADDIEKLLRTAGAITAKGDRSVAVEHNTGVIQTGDGSTAWQNQR